MATQAPTAMGGVMPILCYWPEDLQDYRALGPVSDVERVVGRSHCAWMIGHDYISAIPSFGQGHNPGSRGYRLQKRRLLDHDCRDFGLAYSSIRLTKPVDAEKMRWQGESILQSNLSNVLYWPKQFDNVTVAMLVLIAGLPDHHRRLFLREWYNDPYGYRWQWGHSPFKVDWFTSPRDVYHTCIKYNYVSD